MKCGFWHIFPENGILRGTFKLNRSGSFLLKSSLALGVAGFLTFAGAAHTPLLSSVYAADISVTSDAVTWEGGNTYVVDSDVTIEDRITVNGNVTLLLNEGKTLTAVKGINVQGEDSLTINGEGTLFAGTTNGENVSGEWTGAGIGSRYETGSENKKAGTVIINGGNVVAFGSENGAGIGGGGVSYDTVVYPGGTVSINGGTVKAVGGWYSAGIGGGNQGSGGVIGITGGTVTATGGFRGAGIGGGNQGSAGDIVISGGNVTASGKSSEKTGAGIGTGYDGDGGSISISGENTVVEATGGSGNSGSYGAGSPGIGGGSGSKNGCDISISGGKVTATAGNSANENYSAPGIGTACTDTEGSSGNIRISGGTVTAKGSGNAPGIGIAVGKGMYIGPVTVNVILGGGTITAIAGTTGVVGIGSYQDTNTTETIEVTGDTVLGGDLTVRKLSITADGKLTVPDGVTLSTREAEGVASEITIAEGGALENEGTLTVGSKGTITCSGELINGKNLINDGTVTIAGDGIIFNQDSITGTHADAVIAIAIDRCTVSFNTLGGDPVPVEQIRLKDEPATKPVPSPEKRGYDFTGWYTDENAKDEWDFTRGVTKYRMTLYAGWEFHGVNAEDITGTFTYSDTPFEPEIIVKDRVSGNALIKDRDYTLEYKDNINAGTATVAIKCLGDYKEAGEIKKTFSILKKKITPDVNVFGSYVYTGRKTEPEFTVTYGSTCLTEKDYTAELSNNVNAGTATLLIKEASSGNYGFSDMAVTFTIEKAENPAVIKSSAAVAKDGKTLDLSKLVSGAEGKVSYEIAKEASGCSVDSDTGLFTSGIDICECIVTVTIEGNQNYKGTNGIIKVSVTGEDPTDDPADDLPKQDTPAVSTKVPVSDPGQMYASSEDNLAPVTSSGKIKDQVLDLSNVAGSGIDPEGLKMTAINGSKFTTKAKLKDKDSAKAEGGIKVKVNKKTLIPAITCKKDGSVTLTTEDDKTYKIYFTVQKPKPQKTAKNLGIGSGIAIKTIHDLFGTDIDAGKLEILKQKHSQATLSGNSLIVDPAEKDSIKVLYKYLDKKYSITIKVK